MIIFGTRGVKSTLEQGSFHCPQCNSVQNYMHKKVTNFFTLYFIPLIPLGRLGEYVECQTCRQTFIPRVLEHTTGDQNEKIQGEYEKALKHVMVLMMLADGEIQENELLTVHKVINNFSPHPIPLEELKDYVEETQKKPEDVTTYIERISPYLNEHGKEVVIRCALAVSAADGHIAESEIKMISVLAGAMRMSQTHFDGIFASLTKEKEANALAN